MTTKKEIYLAGERLHRYMTNHVLVERENDVVVEITLTVPKADWKGFDQENAKAKKKSWRESILGL